MPKEIMKAKSPKKPVKIHSREYIESKTVEELSKYCKDKNLPYYGLTKKQFVKNILVWQKGKGVPHKTLNKTWDDMINSSHTLKSVHKRFALKMATNHKKLTYEGLAKEFGVSVVTIQNWMVWPEMKELIEELQNDQQKQLRQKIDEALVPAFEGLEAIAKSKKVSDVKRKSCNDIMGYGGIVNVNAGKVVVQQKQAQGIINKFEDLSIDELLQKKKELKEEREELCELLGDGK